MPGHARCSIYVGVIIGTYQGTLGIARMVGVADGDAGFQAAQLATCGGIVFVSSGHKSGMLYATNRNDV